MKKYDILKGIRNVRGYNKDLFDALCLSSIMILSTDIVLSSILPSDIINSINQNDVLSAEGQASFDDLRKILKDNNKMNDIFKPAVGRFIDYLEKYYPDTDLRKFSYNLKDLTIYNNAVFDKVNDYKKCVASYYNYFNTIHISSKVVDNDSTLFHELIHSCTECYYDSNLISSIDEDGYGIGALEMLTDYYSSRDWTKIRGYGHLEKYAEAIVAVTSFSLDDFCNGGISLLEQRLNNLGFDAKQIINYLDDVYENKTENIDAYEKKYSVDLVETCYKKILENYENSNYDDITNYLCSIKKGIPGRAIDFDYYMISHCNEYGDNRNMIRSIIKKIIKRIIYYELGLNKDDKYLDMPVKYNIVLIGSKSQKGNTVKDKYKLVKKTDYSVSIDEADDILEKYSYYLDHTEEYIIDQTKLQDLYDEEDRVKIKVLNSDMNDESKKLITEYKNTYNIKDDLDIIWYDSDEIEEKIKNHEYPFYLRNIYDDTYYFNYDSILKNKKLKHYLNKYYKLWIEKDGIIKQLEIRQEDKEDENSTNKHR